MHKKIVKKLSDIAMLRFKYVNMVELAYRHYTGVWASKETFECLLVLIRHLESNMGFK